jgi:hypothetical protein
MNRGSTFNFLTVSPHLFTTVASRLGWFHTEVNPDVLVKFILKKLTRKRGCNFQLLVSSWVFLFLWWNL